MTSYNNNIATAIEVATNAARLECASSDPLQFLPTAEPSNWNKNLDIIRAAFNRDLTAYAVVHNVEYNFMVLIATLPGWEVVSVIHNWNFDGVSPDTAAMWNLETITQLGDDLFDA